MATGFPGGGTGYSYPQNKQQLPRSVQMPLPTDGFFSVCGASWKGSPRSILRGESPGCEFSTSLVLPKHQSLPGDAKKKSPKPEICRPKIILWENQSMNSFKDRQVRWSSIHSHLTFETHTYLYTHVCNIIEWMIVTLIITKHIQVRQRLWGVQAAPKEVHLTMSAVCFLFPEWESFGSFL